MTIAYTYTTTPTNIVPYNMSTQQRDIIQGIAWTITGTKDGKSTALGGSLDFDITNGVSDSFVAITDLNTDNLQAWMEARVGIERLTEMKENIEATIDSLPDDYTAAP